MTDALLSLERSARATGADPRGARARRRVPRGPRGRVHRRMGQARRRQDDAAADRRRVGDAGPRHGALRQARTCRRCPNADMRGCVRGEIGWVRRSGPRSELTHARLRRAAVADRAWPAARPTGAPTARWSASGWLTVRGAALGEPVRRRARARGDRARNRPLAAAAARRRSDRQPRRARARGGPGAAALRWSRRRTSPC